MVFTEGVTSPSPPQFWVHRCFTFSHTSHFQHTLHIFALKIVLGMQQCCQFHSIAGILMSSAVKQRGGKWVLQLPSAYAYPSSFAQRLHRQTQWQSWNAEHNKWWGKSDKVRFVLVSTYCNVVKFSRCFINTDCTSFRDFICLLSYPGLVAISWQREVLKWLHSQLVHILVATTGPMTSCPEPERTTSPDPTSAARYQRRNWRRAPPLTRDKAHI